MQKTHWIQCATWMASVLALAVAGCARSEPAAPGSSREVVETAGEDLHNYAGRDWCGEHGVPESACALCDTSLVAEFKERGDWCDEHDRPDSQCFVCHPEFKREFAANYKAKYGEDPPAMPE